MKVFLGWSGDESREIASLLKLHFEDVLGRDTTKFFMSTDIPTGDLWLNKILGELLECNYGIFIITNTNKSSQWIMFEAGAISKGVERNRVSICLTEKEIVMKGPLDAFQKRIIEKNEIRNIINEIKNLECGDINKISTFEMYDMNRKFELSWKDFEYNYKKILDRYKMQKFDLRYMKIFRNPDYDIIIDNIDTQTKNDKSFLSFDFHSHDKIVEIRKDHFIMQTLIFDDFLNWSSFLDGSFRLKFELEIVNINHIILEVKTGYQRKKTIEKIISITQKTVDFNLSDLDDTKKIQLNQVSEICFTAFYPVIHEGHCEFSISNLCIE